MMMQKFKNPLKYANIKTKILSLYFLFAFIPILVLNAIFTFTSISETQKNVYSSIYEIVKKNNELIDIQLSQVEDISNALMNDPVFMNYLNNVSLKSTYELYTLDKELSEYLTQRFRNQDVASVYVMTEKYGFGGAVNQHMFFPYAQFYQSFLYRQMQETSAPLRWFPTYDFTEALDQGQLADVEIPYKYIFSAIRKVNHSYYNTVTHKIQTVFPPDNDVYLVVNFLGSFFSSFVENSISVPDVHYVIFDQNKTSIFDSQGESGTSFITQIQDSISKNGSGYALASVDQKNQMIFYDTISTTGWTSAVVIPSRSFFTVKISSSIWIIVSGIIVTFLSAFALTKMSESIVRPLNNLVHLLDKTGKGEFSQYKAKVNHDEIGYLLLKYNEMNHNIQNLIEQNYISKIKERDAYISALTMQINPHFLYNSLNSINWLAINNNQEEISDCIIRLSSMLQYTVKDKRETVPLEEDLEWLKNYIFIMRMRYSNMFDVTFQIEDCLLTCKVPKFFLQPFVENAIIHAFSEMDKSGKIKIRGQKQENQILFEVIDNGKGMDQKTIDRILKDTDHSIGIPNVLQRIQLLYGSDSGISISSSSRGTIIKIFIQS